MVESSPVTKTELNSQRSNFTNQNELNNQHSNITNEKARLCEEIQRSDSAGLTLLDDDLDDVDDDVDVGPPIPVYRYSEYRDTALIMGGIDTGIVPCNTVTSGINNFTSQQSPLSTVSLFV